LRPNVDGIPGQVFRGTIAALQPVVESHSPI
jgi:hypothetical protein